MPKAQRETLLKSDTNSLEQVLKALEDETENTIRPENGISDPASFALEWAQYTGACWLIDRVRGQLNKREHDAKRARR